jgi:hypothetical protein
MTPKYLPYKHTVVILWETMTLANLKTGGRNSSISLAVGLGPNPRRRRRRGR